MSIFMRNNERSWAIDLIGYVNSYVLNQDLVIKKAGGETTIGAGSGETMFPDLILYANQEQSRILQGWELKMPDVPIEDEAFIKDAQRKAVVLGVDSCVTWNFRYAVLYIRDKQGQFVKAKQWNKTSFIRTREDVKKYCKEWRKLLEDVLLEINQYFITGSLHTSNLTEVISCSAISSLISGNKISLANDLKERAKRDSRIYAYINAWWEPIKSEYEQDERDCFEAYAKNILLNWINRFLFAHLIKTKQNSAYLVDDITFSTDPNKANSIFEEIMSKCGYNELFSSLEYNNLLPADTWHALVEFSNFLKKSGLTNLDQETLHDVLESTVATSKREISGQFTTPPELARILARLTVADWSDNVLDCCCGTGTIPKAVIDIKKELFSINEAIQTVWASDKYRYPLQIANISIAGPETVNLPIHLFQHNALDLKTDEAIPIIDPENGEIMESRLPSFGAVISNLPFIPFEKIPLDDKSIIETTSLPNRLGGRSDLYSYIAVKVAEVLKPGGMLGIITSNSWLGTQAGSRFVRALGEIYHLAQVHISGRCRWFNNANVVTTILILKKKSMDDDAATAFWVWHKSLKELSESTDSENSLVNSATLSKELNPEVATLSLYSKDQMDSILSLNVCYNALFHDVSWLLDIRDKLIPLSSVFTVFRGSRRGWDPLFFPQKGQHNIEPNYLRNVLLNARDVHQLIAQPDHEAFCCGLSFEELSALGHKGAISWIEKFVDQRNNVGRPLPDVLRRKGMHWYQLQEKEIAEMFTAMNPEKRLFFGKFETPSFLNQRLIGLNHKEGFDDLDLNHALLNSAISLFYIEAVGFGRGLGALDISKESLSRCYLLNPSLVDESSRDRIIESFNKIKNRKIRNIIDEFQDEDRIFFEHEVLKAFGIDVYFDNIVRSLLSLHSARLAVKITDA